MSNSVRRSYRRKTDPAFVATLDAAWQAGYRRWYSWMCQALPYSRLVYR